LFTTLKLFYKLQKLNCKIFTLLLYYFIILKPGTTSIFSPKFSSLHWFVQECTVLSFSSIKFQRSGCNMQKGEATAVTLFVCACESDCGWAYYSICASKEWVRKPVCDSRSLHQLRTRRRRLNKSSADLIADGTMHFSLLPSAVSQPPVTDPSPPESLQLFIICNTRRWPARPVAYSTPSAPLGDY